MLRFVDSFDHYSSADIPIKWNSFGNIGSISISAGNGRRGACARMLVGSQNCYMSKTIDSQATWIVGAAIKFSAISGGPCTVFSLYDAGTPQVDVRIKSDGNFQVTRNGTVLGTGTVPVAATVYNYLELKVLISATVGTVDLRLNGASLMSLTGQNTKNSTNSTANQIVLGAINNIEMGGSCTFDVDDVYICDGQGSVNNSYLGDCRVDCYMPTGNGTNSQFTNDLGNSTNNYTHVDEATPDYDTSYVADLTVNDIDSYAITGLTHTPLSIFGLQTNLVARKDDAGSRSLAPLTYRSATAFAGTSVAVGTSYTDFTQIYENDPVTSAAWTKANINATEFGVKVAA